MKLKLKDKSDLEFLQTIDNKINNLPLRGVPGFSANISDTPGVGWTLRIYDIEETEDGFFEYPIDENLDEDKYKDEDKLTKEEKDRYKAIIKAEKDKKNNV